MGADLAGKHPDELEPLAAPGGSVPEPDRHLPRALVDEAHHGHLRAALGHVGLVDAHGVNPEDALGPAPAQGAERRVQVLRHGKRPPVELDVLWVVGTPPDVREGLIGWFRVEADGG